jgi:hypothetical protein
VARPKKQPLLHECPIGDDGAGVLVLSAEVVWTDLDADEPESQGDEGAVALGRLLTAERHTFVALELANGLLNASAPAVERF